MMSHLKDCLVESPSMAGSAEGDNEVEGVKVRFYLGQKKMSSLNVI